MSNQEQGGYIDSTMGMPPVSKNYYGGSNIQNYDTIKYRLDPKGIIEFCDGLRGIERDRFQKVVRENVDWKVCTDEGVRNIQQFLLSSCGSVTHLTNYTNESRVLLQQRHHVRAYLRMVVLNMKRWKVQNKNLVVMPAEKLIFESMLRAKEGFENNNISRQINVHETIDRNGQMPEGQQRQGFLSRWFN